MPELEENVNPECSVVRPCGHCDYCAEYYRWIWANDHDTGYGY